MLFSTSLCFCNECRCNLLKLTVCKQPERIGLTVSLHSASIRLDFTVLSLSVTLHGILRSLPAYETLRAISQQLPNEMLTKNLNETKCIYIGSRKPHHLPREKERTNEKVRIYLRQYNLLFYDRAKQHIFVRHMDLAYGMV